MVWYVVRITEKSGNVRYLGVDAMGGYCPESLRHAELLASTEKERAMQAGTVNYFREHGAKIEWCRVECVAAHEEIAAGGEHAT